MSFEQPYTTPKLPNEDEIAIHPPDEVPSETIIHTSTHETPHISVEPLPAEEPSRAEQNNLAPNADTLEKPSIETTPIPLRLKPSPDGVNAPNVDLEAISKLYERKGLFSPAVLERLKNAPEAVRSAATKAYEGLSSVAMINRALGRMEMSYNGYFVDHHESNALRLKGNFDRHDAEYKTLEQTQKEIEVQMAAVAAAGIPGADSLQTFLQKIDKQKASVLQKRQATEIKIKERQEKITNYTEKRDRIANRFIAELDEKLEPHQERMRELDDSKAACETEINIAKARHEQELTALKTLSDRKKGIVDSLLKAGMSQRQINTNAAVVNIDKHINEGRNRVRFEMEKLDAKRSKVTYQVAQVKKKSSPYEQKRAALERLKNGRRVQINLPMTETVAAQNSKIGGQSEETTRSADNSEMSAANDNTVENNQNESTPNRQPNLESLQPIRLRETPTKYLEALNKHLNAIFPQAYDQLKIEPKDFFKFTKLKPSSELSASRFVKVVNVYYMSKGIDPTLREKVLRTVNRASLAKNLTT